MQNVIHDRFIQLIQELELTDVEIARKLKVPKQHVSQWKQGYRNIPEKYLVQTIKEFDLDANWVIKGS